MCDWDIDDLAIVLDYPETEDRERFTLSSPDAGKIYCSRAFVTLHAEREVYIPLWHTYNAIYPWVTVEIPNRFRSNSITKHLVDLGAVSEVLKDLLCNGTGQPFLIIRVFYERDPSGDSERREDNYRRPSALNGREFPFRYGSCVILAGS